MGAANRSFSRVRLSGRLLQTAQGSLLDDEQLVNTLNSSKTTSQEVTEQLQVSEQTEIKIDTAREVSGRLLSTQHSCRTRAQILWLEEGSVVSY